MPVSVFHTVFAIAHPNDATCAIGFSCQEHRHNESLLASAESKDESDGLDKANLKIPTQH
jgi:hypothetical protein